MYDLAIVSALVCVSLPCFALGYFATRLMSRR